MPSEGAGPLGAQPRPQVLELAASKRRPFHPPPLWYRSGAEALEHLMMDSEMYSLVLEP